MKKILSALALCSLLTACGDADPCVCAGEVVHGCEDECAGTTSPKAEPSAAPSALPSAR